jgi:integrase
MPWRDVQKMMAAASTHDTSMVPSLAIGFFSGLRVNEIRLLDWQQIDLVARRITVMPEVAKKRRARHVQIEDNLLAWLAPYKQESGPVTPEGEKWRSRLDAVREKAGVTWPRNCMRHSFASHHLIKYGDAVKTAMQLGHHRDTSMLFEHYRALVTVEDAAAYWRIKPEAEANTLRFPAAG